MDTMDLRPMTLGEVLDRTFSLYKGNFLLFAGIVAIPYLVVVIFSVAYSSLLAGPAIAPGGATNPAAAFQMLGGLLTSFLVIGLIYLLVFASAQAATVMAVSDLYLGRQTGLALSYSRVKGRILPVLVVMILIVLLAAAVSSAPILLAAILIPVLGRSILLGLLMFLAFIAALVFMVIVFCRTAVAVPAATLEDTGVTGAISRSFRLTKGSAAQIFVVYLLLIFLTFLAMFIFQFPFLLAAGSPLKPHAIPLWMSILQGLASWVSGVIVAPISTIAFSLIYYNQRVRKEAFDLEKLIATFETGEAPASPSVA